MLNSEDTTTNSIINIGEDKNMLLEGKPGRGDFIDHTIPPEILRQRTAILKLAGEIPVSTSPQIELRSKDKLLTCLGLAIDEAKLVRSLIKSKDLAGELKENDPFSQQLIILNKEINYLEVKLTQVRRTANRH